MIRNAEVPLPDAIAMASLNPAREAGLSDKGEIAVGKDADLVVLSPELEVMRTYVNGVENFRTMITTARASSRANARDLSICFMLTQI